MAIVEPKICMFPYGRLIWCSAPIRAAHPYVLICERGTVPHGSVAKFQCSLAPDVSTAPCLALDFCNGPSFILFYFLFFVSVIKQTIYIPCGSIAWAPWKSFLSNTKSACVHGYQLLICSYLAC